MKGKTVLLSGLIAIFLLFGLIAPQAAEAKDIIINAGEASLYLNPAGTQAVTNDATQTLKVMVDDVTDLTAYHLELTYDAADITITAVRNGAVLVAPTEPALFEPTNWTTGDDSGIIKFGMAQQGTGGNPSPVTLTDPGVLLEIDFTIDVQGDTTITLDSAKSLLVSWPDAFAIAFTTPVGQGSAVYTLDTVAPTITSIKANGAAGFGDETAVGMTLTVEKGYTVDTIDIVMSEPVTVVAGTQVTLAGVPYGSVAVSTDGLTLTVTPLAGNEVAGIVGSFNFVVPAGSVKDLAGNAWVNAPVILVVTDTVAPVVTKIEALSASDGNFVAVGTTLTVSEGYTVDTIEITLSEPVVVAAGTVVTMDGFGPYGTIVASGNKLIVTPYPGNETAAIVGTFTFSVPAGSIEDPSGNDLGAISLTLVVQDASFFITQDFGPWDQVAYPGWVNLGWQYLPGFDTSTIASIEIGMKDAAGNLIVEYTASGDQIIYQRNNGYINPDNKQSSLPFYQFVAPGFSTAGEPILEGPDLDATVIKGSAFTAWAPVTGFVCVTDVEGTQDCKTVTYSGELPLIVGTLTAQDFGYWATSTTVGDVVGYTAGFSLDVKFTDATIVVQLFSGDTLLQTNTSVDGKFDHANEISGPFDVFGTFNYATDGYWTNVRAGTEYGQILIPTKVVATATLASGKVVTAENTLLTSTVENSLPMVQWQTTITGNVKPDGILATFPLSIPKAIVDEPFKINSQITLGAPLPAGSLVSVTRNGVPLLTNVTLSGTGPWWITDLLGAPLSASADFDANYGGKTELYMITITGNTQPINTTLTLNSIISRDGFVNEKIVLAEETFALVVDDLVAPVVSITGATADGTAMSGNLEDGYILPTTNNPAIDHLVQMNATVNEPLADEYFGLKLISSTVTAADLKAYYAAKPVPEPFLTYLNSAADGVNPFVYIKGTGLSLSLVDAAKHDLISTDVAMTIPDTFPLGTYTVQGVVKDAAGNETTVTLKLIVTGDRVAPVVTISGATADGTAMGGNLQDGYVLITNGVATVDRLVQMNATVDEPLADTYFGLKLISSTVTPAELQAYYTTRGVPEPYLSYLIGAANGTNPFVYIKGSTVKLVDAAKHVIALTDADMTIPDNFPVGTYTVQGVVKDAAGNETTVTLKLIVVRTLAVTNADLKSATVATGPYTALPGTFTGGFVMELDPTVAWYYLDTDLITSNNTLADGLYPFTLNGGPTDPIFYVKVEGTTYTLIDAYLLAHGGGEQPLRINGDFTPGTYTYTGNLTDVYGSSDSVSIKITFVNALSVTNADLFWGTDPLVIDQPLDGTFANGFAMVLDPMVPWYYLDTETIVSNNTLADGRYTFYESTNPTQPVFYLDVAAGDFSLIDAYKWLVDGVISPLRVNGTFAPGTHTYTGEVTDIYGSTAPLSIKITFNDVPYATAQSVTVVEDTPTAITLSGLDLYPGTKTYAVVTSPTHGTLSGTAPDLTYTPAADYHGSDSFTFTLSDGTLTSTVATVSITVTSVLDAPTVDSTNLPGPYMVGLEQAFQVTLTNPNNGDVFTNVLARFRLEGISLADIASFQYLETSVDPDVWLPLPLSQDGTGVVGDFGPATGFPMPAPYTATSQFKITFNKAGTYPATVVLYDVAADPDVELDRYEANAVVVADFEVTDVVLMRSVDQTTWYNVPGNFTAGFAMPLLPSQAYYYFDVSTLTATRPLADGSYPFYLTETPGTDFFAYWAAKGVVSGATGWQGLMWQIINGDAPMFFLKVEGTNYSLIDRLQGAPNLLRINGDYFPGAYAFTGVVEDRAGFTDEVPVNIIFNDIPVAADQSVTVVEDTATPITLSAVDIFPGTKNYTVVTQPAHGTAVLAGNVVTYTPAPDYFGADSFTFTANDGTLTSNIAAVTITVTPVKDQVKAVDDAYETNEDTTLTVPTPGVRANDIDPDNNLWTASLVTDVKHGSLSLKGDGSFIYKPDPNFYGTDTFEYELVTYPAIQNLWTDIALVTITVHPVLDPPALSTDLPASVYVDYQTEFGVTLKNPDFGDAFTGVRVQFRLIDTQLSDITSLEYFETTTGTWMNLPLTQNGADVIGWFGPGAGFPMPAPYSATSQFRLTVAEVGTYNYEMHLYDVVADPDFLLASLAGSLEVVDVDIFNITDFGLWGEVWPGALSLGWQYVPEFDTLDIASIEVGMLDASRTSIIKYTADEAQIAWQRANGYITPPPAKLSSAPFYVEYNGTPIAAGRDFDWTVIFGTAFADWNPRWGYVKVVDVNGYEEYAEVEYTGPRPDITPPTVGEAVAVGVAPYGDVTAVDMTFTVPQGYVVGTIEFTMSEPVTVVAGTEVTLAGVPYGLVTVSADGLTLIVTPYTGNEVANLIGTFTFVVPAGSIKDLVGHALEEVEATLIVTNVAPVAVADSYTATEDTALTVPARGVLVNDTDYDPAILTAVKVTDPANGTLVLNADGSFTYTPAADFNGTDTFTYKANDGLADSNIVTVTITVAAANDAPVAQEKSVTTPEETALDITLGATDVDGDTLTFVIVTQPAHGTVTLVGGVATYTPALDFNGTDTFTFKANDGTADSNVATVTITVTPVNDAPVAQDKSVTTPEETALDITLVATDVDGDTLTFVIVTQPAHGTVTLVGGVATYTPALDFNGTDTFTFKANDGTADSNVATVTITVTPVNDTPRAVDDLYTTDEDTTLTIAAPGVMANDTDVDLDVMEIVLVTDVQNGSLTLLGNGSFTYVPDADFFGTDSFVYQLVTYPGLQSSWTDEATVTITVNPINDAPVLGPIPNATIPELVAFTFTATATDVDLPAQVLTFSLVGAPEGAAITAAGVFTWTPSELQGPGVYSFTVKVCDAAVPALCDEQAITLTVTEVNTAPVAQAQTVTTLEETPVDVTLVATDAENDALTYTIIAQPAHGTVILVGTTATYTPDLDYFGPDSFTFKANDGLVDSNVATVSITVTNVNEAPVAVDDTYTMAEKATLTIAAPGVLANDTDVDGDALSAILVDDVLHGTLTLNAEGSFTYTPNNYFNGTDSFTYKAKDAALESDLAVVTITVTPVNDWPIANDDFYEVVTGNELVKNAAEGVLANDVLLDPDEQVSIQILDEPQHGILSMNDDGSFTYTPDAGFMGTDTFRYVVLSVRTITAAWSDDAMVTITVNPYMRLFLPIIWQ